MIFDIVDHTRSLWRQSNATGTIQEHDRQNRESLENRAAMVAVSILIDVAPFPGNNAGAS
jgi:hypothetical protein